MDTYVSLLISLPFLIAAVLYFVRNDKARGYIVYAGGLAIAILSILTAATWFIQYREPVSFDLSYNDVLDKVILAGEIVLMMFVTFMCFKHRKPAISLLSIIPTLMVVYTELCAPGIYTSKHIMIDGLTFIMILIVGIIGVCIGVYAIGYMRGYHVRHSAFKDRRNFFFCVIFIFYGAMFGLLTSMNIIWIDFFWEVTSVCSFLLIGYTQTDEAINNSFRALWMNLLGGAGIAVAVMFAVFHEQTLNLYNIIEFGVKSSNGLYAGGLIPIVMLAFAALTKSAQFPFSRWLLGAMVAPTPSSALLHSATMVKAGVYMLLRISVALHGNTAGQMVYFIGGFTFFMASLLAISHTNGKSVLAYSTISNLGLITACAGMGVEETIWAAVFLIIFHAVSKSMLFQCVGAIEVSTGSKNIENMQGLASRIPKLAFILMVGIAGMFLAPFGMLVSKWAALKAFIDAPSTVMVLFIVFGSSSTMFYWTKWFAKILGRSNKKEKDLTQKSEYLSMFFHATLVILLCILFPIVSQYAVEPFMLSMFGTRHAVLSEGNIMIMIIMVVSVMVVPIFMYLVTRNVKETNVIAYMGGDNIGDNDNFIDSFGEPKQLAVANWYITDWFGDKKLLGPSIIISTIIIVVSLCLVLGGAF